MMMTKDKLIWMGVGVLAGTALCCIPVVGDAWSSLIVKVRDMVGGN